MNHSPQPRRPLIGVTCDLEAHANGRRVFTYSNYASRVWDAGGMPVLLPPVSDSVGEVLERCDGLGLTGGDDPRTEAFGEPTHAEALPIAPERQAFEVALLRERETQAPGTPVLGVCLGMQLMALCDGGRLDQHMPDTHKTHGRHWESNHSVEPVSGGSGLELAGVVRSKHRQCVADPGGLRVVARATDGVIEAIARDSGPFYVGVQWHPERTEADAVGKRLFEMLVEAAR